MVEFFFWGAVLLIFFAYFGYPLSLLALGRFYGHELRRAPITPSVTFIITVHNEEKRIKDKLDNTLSLDYPRESLQILVASDGSTDRTNDIVRGYAGQGVELLQVPQRGGKENAQKEAVQLARGDVLVFSDVATTLATDGLLQLVSSFADATVGCVSSEDRLSGPDGKPSGEGFYVRYEMWLRRLETRVHSLVGLSGSLFAARKEVCADFSADMQSDFRTVLNSVKMGLRGVTDPCAIGFYLDAADPAREWDRKVRTVLRGLTVFFRHLELLNVRQYGLFSYELFCHKLLRWSVPLLLMAAIVTNVLLAFGSFSYLILLCTQAALYLLALAGWWKEVFRDRPLFKIPTYFVTVNVSILMAWWRYLRGHRIVTWAPTVR